MALEVSPRGQRVEYQTLKKLLRSNWSVKQGLVVEVEV
jgi:hypothetical protein